MSDPARPGIRRITGRTWADVVVLLVLTAVGILGFAPSFAGWGFLVAGLGGVLLGAITALLTGLFRIGALLTLVIAVLGYFLAGTALALPGQAVFGVLPTLRSLASLAIGSVYGWADLVTLTTPVGAPVYIAVVPYAAGWLVALVSVTLAVRWLSERPRAAWRFGVALIAPVVLYIAGVLVGTHEPYQALARGIAFAVLALVWLGWRRPVGGGIAQGGAARLRRRKLAGTAALLVGAVAVGGAAGIAIAPPRDDRFVLREEIQPPFDPLDYPSPLAGFRHFTKQVTDEVQFTVTGLEPGDVIRMATLDSFTGKLWNVTGPESSAAGSGSFALVGRRMPAPDLVAAVERPGVTFTIADYRDVWMPGVGYPTALELGGTAADRGDDLRYNPATGMLVLTSGLADGDSFTVDALVQQPISVEDLRETPVAAVELPPVAGSPDIVTVKAQEFAGSTTAPIEQLEAIRLTLIDQGFLSHGLASDQVPSRAGHGADRITELFERTQMIGDEEQYASAFALMARALGFPARVVMGFAPDIPQGAETIEVTGDDVTAWVEVAFDGVGWVPFDPTPEETDIPQDQVPKPQSEPQPQVRQPPLAEHDEDDLLTPVELEETTDDDPAAFILPGWVVVLGLAILIPAAILLLPLLVVAVLKARRMRRRRSAPRTPDRVAGAWEELADRYAELGFDLPPNMPRPGVAERLESQGGGAGLVALAERTDEAVFSGRDVAEPESEQVWTEAMAAVAGARAAAGRFRRIVADYRVRAMRDAARRLAERAAGRRR